MGGLFQGYSLYEFLWFFAIYAFLGWCAEVAYAAMCQGKFVNRGFLNGPYCPIYGCGVVLVIGLLTPLKGNKLILFVGSVLLTSALEWITGFVLEKVFHDKWWDYSDVPFNLNGYICLKFSILWGFACMFILEIFHPTVEALVGWIPAKLGWPLVVILLAAFFADACVTARSILRLNQRLEHMEEIAEKMREISDHIGEEISENVLELMEKKKEYEELAQRRSYVHDRLMKAYPGMRSNRHGKALEDVRRRLENGLEKLAADLERIEPSDDTDSTK
ncbi:MAG: hypothetical protein J6E42_06780 [Firmicutes bacterium]|nr:hypothetical protein [Bacillota bacterium]